MKFLFHMTEDSKVGNLEKNLTRALVWRKQEGSFLCMSTTSWGGNGGLKKFFVGSVTNRRLCSDDCICLHKSEH